MQIKTIDGIAEAMPLSDIQQYNKKLDENTFWLKALVIFLGFIGLIGFAFIFWLFWLTSYLISNNVINNIVAECV